MALGYCRECGGRASTEAPACPHCGAADPTGSFRVVPAAQPQMLAPRPNNGVAAVLSLFIPGAGQIYKGHVGAGIAWMCFTFLGYLALIIPGLVLHLICILNASSTDPA
jgi:hypothetical protein